MGLIALKGRLFARHPRTMGYLDDQDGVVSRPQLLASGWADYDIKRALRRRDLATIRPGVYINHTGLPTWQQRAWASLLAASARCDLSDVALSHQSAMSVHERVQSSDGIIHLSVPAERKPSSCQGIRVHRTRHFAERVQGAGRPPRIRYEHALIDVAQTKPRMDAVGLFAHAVSGRYSTAPRISAALAERAHVADRRWYEAVLCDIEAGTHSVLEREFLMRVVRPHGLPRPQQQGREVTPAGVAYRDARMGGVVIELDGHAFHSSVAQHEADLERDLWVAVQGRRTVRLGWRQVSATPCRTAAALGLLMSGLTLRACSPTCSVSISGHQVNAHRHKAG